MPDDSQAPAPAEALIGHFKPPAWEYLAVAMGPKENQVDVLNSYGADGWEVFAIEFHGSIVAYMKRLIFDAAEADETPQTESADGK